MKTVRLHDFSMACEDEGSGPPVLLVHGFPLHRAFWQGQVAPLAERHRVLVPDLRGFGASGGAGDVTPMDQFADDLLALLTQLEIHDPVTFVGLSMGGYIGFAFMRRYPERVARLALLDTKAEADTEEARQNRLAMAEQVLREGPAVAADAMLPKLLAPRTLEERPVLVESLRTIMLGNSAQGIAAAQRGMAARPNSTDLLGRIHVPTLVVAGELDSFTPPDSMRRMASRIPGSRFEIIPGAGHLPPLEQPDALNRLLLAFLTT